MRHRSESVERPRKRGDVTSRAKVGLSALASLALVGAGLALPTAGAFAGPAPDASASSYTTAGQSFTGTVPDGVCAVRATVLGGAGGSATAGNTPSPNGAGARISATFRVAPGEEVSGTVAGGGGEKGGKAQGGGDEGGQGGANGGGAGGTARGQHPGAGGGGLSELKIGGVVAIVAGGGGGTGGGHPNDGKLGQGGDAGVPTGVGVTPGSAGGAGKDAVSATVGGGVGGGDEAAPGAGGVNSADSTVNGNAGSARSGGAGGLDPNYDAGGGGGAGYAGGGGGASTVKQNSDNGVTNVSGAGGGGGSSYIAPNLALASGSVAPKDIAAESGPRLSRAGNGADGSVTLDWITCDYDLAVTKTASSAAVGVGDTITWTVTVVNNGPADMTRGDTLTLTDNLPGDGATNITGITVTGGTDSTIFTNDAVTCDAAVGKPMPATIECSRPFAVAGAEGSGKRGLNVGEKLTLTYTQVATGTSLANTAAVTDRGDTANNSSTSTVQVAPKPTAADDESLGNTLGATVTVPTLGNDSTGLVASTVRILNGTTPVTTLTVENEGTWSVNETSGAITFTPLTGYTGNPTPIRYQVADDLGQIANAEVTVTYKAQAIDDASHGNALGTAVNVNALANDSANVVPTSVVFDGATGNGKTLVVNGQGTWTVNAQGRVTFTPNEGYMGNPTPVNYTAHDGLGNNVSATVTVTYVPQAQPDEKLLQPFGPVTVNALSNDSTNLVAGSVKLEGASGDGKTLTVDGQGTWTVGADGAITFTSEDGYTGNPAPVHYTANDGSGRTDGTVRTTVTISYKPVAENDESLGNTIGDAVTVDVRGNDKGDYATPANVQLIDAGKTVKSITVPGEGEWKVVDGTVVFTPQAGFEGNPTPIPYRITDTAGETADATVTITYTPIASPDVSKGNTIGDAVTVNPLSNDKGLLDPKSVTINGATGDGKTLVVPGEGTWTVDPESGLITFTPEEGFVHDPEAITYTVAGNGTTVSSTVTVEYVPEALPDASHGNKLGEAVTIDPLANDEGDLDTTSVVFTENGETTLVVDGEGIWTIDPTTGLVTFAPEKGFEGNPAAVSYNVTDVTGDVVSSTITVTYKPEASNDASRGNKPGSTVTVDVLGNDKGNFDPTTLRLIDPMTKQAVKTLVVKGEGTWSVSDKGTITFVPEAGFTGNPTPVTYEIEDRAGNVTTATVTIEYLKPAAAAPTGLAQTGSAAQSWLLLGGGLLLTGIAVIVMARVRRSRATA